MMPVVKVMLQITYQGIEESSKTIVQVVIDF